MENFNELFKKKLAEQQFDGKEKYWSQLEKKLNENAQEKVVVAWYKKWLLPLIAVVGIGVTAMLYNSSNTALTENTAPQSEQKSSAQRFVQTSENSTHQNSATQTNLEAESNTILNSETNITKNPARTSNELASANVGPKEISVLKSNTELSSPSSNPTSKSFSKNNSTKSLLASTSTTAKEPELSNSAYIADNLSDENLLNHQTNIEQTNQIQVDEYVSENINSTDKGLDFSQVEMPLAMLSPKALSAIINTKSASNLAANLLPINAKKPKISLSLSVYGGAMYSLKNLLTSNGNTADYLNRRKNEEINSIKPNVGIDAELKRGHWTLTSGINFHQQGEKRNYNDQFKRTVPYDSLVININNNSAWLVDSSMFYALQYNSIITSYDSTITYYDENTGLFTTAQLPVNITQTTVIDTNFYYLIDSTYNQDIDTLKTNYALKRQVLVNDPDQPNLKGRNTFSYIEVPVLIGYEWGIRRFRLSLKGGIGIGLLTRQQSFYLTTDEAEIAPVSTNVYTKIMYNGIVRAGLHYNFTPQFGVDIVPFSRINLNNMTNKNATFQQKYSNVGLQVGFNYKL
jgi:hypothetical protein